MKISCPFLHYPRYALKVYMKDGGVMNMRGPGTAEIEVPVEEEDVVTMVCESRDEAGTTGHSRMWCGDEWSCYTDADLEAVLNQPSPPEAEPEPSRKPSRKSSPSRKPSRKPSPSRGREDVAWSGDYEDSKE